MNLGIIDILLVVLFFLLISVLPYLIVGVKKKSIAHILLAAFIIAKALCITNFLAFRLSQYTLEYFPHLFYFGSSFTILWGTLLYFYTKSVLDRDFKFRKIDILHFVPFSLHFIYLSISFHFHSADYKRAIINSGGVFSSDVELLILFGVNLSILLYTVASIFILINYRRELKNNYSEIESKKMSWLSFVIGGFLVKWSGDVWFLVANLTGSDTYPSLIVSRGALFIFINIMIYNGLKHKSIFSGFDSAEITKKITLSKSVLEEYKRKLLLFMSENQPYLDPLLSLQGLSVMTDIPQRSLSEVINVSFQKNFYDFINGYRLQYVEKMLLNNSAKKTILQILYEAGFNSKSSFNSFFKKHTGLTPTEYQKQKCNKSNEAKKAS